VGSGHQAYLINGTYKTRATESFEEKNKWLEQKKETESKVKKIESGIEQSLDKRKELKALNEQRLFAISELGKAYRHLLLNFLRLGLLDQATQTLHDLEHFLATHEKDYNDSLELKAWIEEFKSYQTALGLLERAALKPKHKLRLLNRAVWQLGQAKRKFQILRFEDYLLEIRTLEEDVRAQIKKVQDNIEKDKKQ
jgi:hypothetical protein